MAWTKISLGDAESDWPRSTIDYPHDVLESLGASMSLPRRIVRIDDRSKHMHGYLAAAVVDKRNIRRFFSDLRHGSSSAALDAAEASVNSTLEEHIHYLALRRRHRRRANSPGEIPGVNRVPAKPTNDADYWVARWIGADGKRHKRSFRITKYGELRAYELALAARLKGTVGDRERLRLLTETTAAHQY